MLIAQHGLTLLKVSRRVSLCVDDAHDAFQRGPEIYLRRLDTIGPRTETASMLSSDPWSKSAVR